MKAEYKEIWLKALRRRNEAYLQTTGRLTRRTGRQDRFCCLGVLVNEVEGFAKPGEAEYGDHTIHMGMLTGKFLHKVGLSCTQQSRLAELNDKQRWSFGKIANWIEKHL